MKRLLERAHRMIAIKSVSADGNEELSNYVSVLMKNTGMKVSVQQVMHSLGDISKRQYNVLGILGDTLVDVKTRKGLLLTTHLDTLGPGILEQWTETGGNPIQAMVKDDRIYGLGSADAKLDFLCKLSAIQKFREKKLRQPIYLAGTCGEEIGMFGARYLLQSLALNPQYVLVGKPTGLKIVHKHKSMDLFKVSIGYQIIERGARGFNRRVTLFATGRASHSGYPTERGGKGIHSIDGLMKFVQKAIDNGFDIKFTRLEGGDAVNQTPDWAQAEFYLTSHQLEDFKRFFREAAAPERGEFGGVTFKITLGGLGDVGIRFHTENLFPALQDLFEAYRELQRSLTIQQDDTFDVPTATVSMNQMRQGMGETWLMLETRCLPGVVQTDLKEQVKKFTQQVATKYPALNIRVQHERSNPALKVADDSEFVALCGEVMEAADIMPNLDRVSMSSEAGHFTAKDYPTLVFGPGSPMEIHGPNEFNSISELQKAVLFYEKMIEKVCL
ncbi:MAG: M20/M25/M40 family metallo-hydrolase [Bacteriovoracia bacterium]